ncbi:MAG: hypothetical protein ACK55H_09780 [Cyanobacteriota bacterium]
MLVRVGGRLRQQLAHSFAHLERRAFVSADAQRWKPGDPRAAAAIASPSSSTVAPGQ